jgi:hypothetical protein
MRSTREKIISSKLGGFSRLEVPTLIHLPVAIGAPPFTREFEEQKRNPIYLIMGNLACSPASFRDCPAMPQPLLALSTPSLAVAIPGRSSTAVALELHYLCPVGVSPELLRSTAPARPPQSCVDDHGPPRVAPPWPRLASSRLVDLSSWLIGFPPLSLATRKNVKIF